MNDHGNKRTSSGDSDPIATLVRDLAEGPPPKSIDTLKAASDVVTKADRAHRDERIRVRAYYLWVEQGRPSGRDLEFWSAASAEII